MGYTTIFEGHFDLNKKLDAETHEFLNKLADTRRMKRNVDESVYGVEGEFYVDGEGFKGQEKEDNVIDNNEPPSTQPSLWLQWVPTDDGMAIKWDGGEKFYDSVEWIKYLIKSILAPKGYILNGIVNAEGEDGEKYYIHTIDNSTVAYRGFSKEQKRPDWKKWYEEY